MQELVDYAKPLINIEASTKRIHEHSLNKQFAAAHEETMKLAVEVRILQRTLEIMMERTTT